MKILYILKHNPWGISGGCYACRNYFELFTEIFKETKFDILICEEYTKDIKEHDFHNCKFISVPSRSRISKYLSPVTNILHRHQKVATKLLKGNTYDYCIFDHNSIAGSLVDLCRGKSVKTIVLNHNCELEYFSDNNSKLKNLLLLPSVKRNERNSYLKCDYNIFLTEEDKQLFYRIYGESLSKCLVGGCFFNKNEVIQDNIHVFNPEKIRIVISGTIGNVQNIDGINYFLKELYSFLPPNVEIIIAGKNPPQGLIDKVKKYSNVEVIANPDDILTIIKSCDIFLCPTRLGGGMKLRIMDGIRCCIPILSHEVSARGYKEFVRKGFLYSFDNTNEFIKGFNSIVYLLKNDHNLKKRMRDSFYSITFASKYNYFKEQIKDDK